MGEKVGRNDPCPCGSGKKYKSCCLQKQQQKSSSLGKRKFTAKVLSGGGINKVSQQMGIEQGQTTKVVVDYTTLMERSFGEALHSHEEKPPLPSDSLAYLVSQEEDESSSEQEKK